MCGPIFLWRRQLECALWAVVVVMVGESAERTLELSLASDEEPVEALHAERAEFPSPEPAYTPRDPFRCFRRRRQSAGFAAAESRPDTATGQTGRFSSPYRGLCSANRAALLSQESRTTTWCPKPAP